MHLSSHYSKVNVQLLKPGLYYPENIFKHQDALYYPSKDIVFIATKPSPIQDDDFYTEVAVWEPEEIRLLGTLTLSVPENAGWVSYAPWHFSVTAIPEVTDIPITVDLSSDSAISSCIDYANGLLVYIQDKSESSYILRSQKSLPRSDAHTEKVLFENIEPSNNLLIRGIYHLIKCPLLISADHYFMEEAFINLQISTEAALQIIRERLRTGENPHPSKKDVFEYIDSNFT